MLTREDFMPYLNSKFYLEYTSQTIITSSVQKVEIELIEIDVLNYSGYNREAFVLFFAQSLDKTVLPQSTYRVTHAVLPVMDIFLVPKAPNHNQNIYEAVFA